MEEAPPMLVRWTFFKVVYFKSYIFVTSLAAPPNAGFWTTEGKEHMEKGLWPQGDSNQEHLHVTKCLFTTFG